MHSVSVVVGRIPSGWRDAAKDLLRKFQSLFWQMHSVTDYYEKNFSNAKGAEDLFRQFLANALECVGEQQQ